MIPPSEQKQHLTIYVRGSVQGVYFRRSTQHIAEGLGITGIARNNPDGSVTIEAEGEPDALHELIDWCYIGPRKASVTNVEVEPGHLQYFTSFRTE